MENEENQVVDLETSTEEAEEVLEETEEEEKGVEYWKAEALKNKAILERNKNKVVEKKEVVTEKKSGDLDYAQKAFLVASGIKGEAEMKLVKDWLKDTGKDLDSLLDSKRFQSELEEVRALDKTEKATPKGKRSGNVATDSVEYWMSKPLEDVPHEMRIKVVNAKLKQEQSKGVFYNS
jgi:DNA segregation ATPase FtsK/SpoIIIE-like protein